MLNAALRKDKLKKSNIGNHLKGTNATGFMCNSYKVWHILNGVEKMVLVNCYTTIPPVEAEPQKRLALADGKCFQQQRPVRSTGINMCIAL